MFLKSTRRAGPECVSNQCVRRLSEPVRALLPLFRALSTENSVLEALDSRSVCEEQGICPLRETDFVRASLLARLPFLEAAFVLIHILETVLEAHILSTALQEQIFRRVMSSLRLMQDLLKFCNRLMEDSVNKLS